MTTWHDRMEHARIERGVSPAKLARMVGVSAAVMSEWRSKKIKYLKAENAFAVCDSLRIRMPWLLYAKGEMCEGDRNTETGTLMTDPIKTALELLSVEAIDQLEYWRLFDLAYALQNLCDYATRRGRLLDQETEKRMNKSAAQLDQEPSE